MYNNCDTSAYVSAQDVCAKLQIPYSKINHYTYLGLFEIARKDGNKRLYEIAQVERRFQAISRLINEGYPLVLIRKKLLGGNGHELL